MKHIKRLKDIGVASGVGAIMAFGLAGCGESGSTGSSLEQTVQKQGATVFIEKNSDGSYKIADEFPSNETRIFLREAGADGTMSERLLSQAEIDKLLQEENAKIEAGESGLTNSTLSSGSGGLGLGEAILASAAGAIIGSWIGSKLFNNPAYQNSRQNAYKNPSAYNRSVNSFNKAGTASAASKAGNSGRSGFFGGGSGSGSSQATGG
ncbi:MULTISPECIES: UPF0323 family lipoprotein [Campylobacter]|uniref:UPF0323 family lipoprotein n=1 Tax=Campylobacter TaxID=194 RepID=UPI000A348A0B|nr:MULTISPECIES: UPF0323 family lipoprotein [Campylobacter]MBE6430695.1 hypothetical protein [Campylobacter sp.]MBO5063273.1 UPF0323 family lipoprotein [Campylobacter sp.]MBQ3167950.1 UPF0323 family lipoprotein [Campylobacter sp.]MBQ7135724.1 UPF0323 family lipoprotein [Campylobacter sp.]MBQ8610045.1 UPF0323 family lipoprotein [Campylobacter sp.]